VRVRGVSERVTRRVWLHAGRVHLHVGDTAAVAKSVRRYARQACLVVDVDHRLCVVPQVDVVLQRYHHYTRSSQSPAISVASLLLYVVFFRFKFIHFYRVCMFS